MDATQLNKFLEITTTKKNAIEFIIKAVIKYPDLLLDYPVWIEECKKIYEESNTYNKIRAIKHYRNTTGLGLREAKELIEGLIECKWDFTILRTTYPNMCKEMAMHLE